MSANANFRKVEHISLLCATPRIPTAGDSGRWRPVAGGSGATVAPHGHPHAPTSQHPACRLRPGAAAVVAPARASSLPWRDRLRAEGLEFTNYFTHSSPCSPSRASLFTGRYLPGHGVVDNVIMPEHTELPTIDPDPRVAPRRRRLPLLLHRQVAPVPLPHPGHGGLRLRRLGRQRPPLHGMGRHRRALRPDHRRQRRPVAGPQRRGRRGRPTGGGSGGPSPGSSPWPWSIRTTSCGFRSISPATGSGTPTTWPPYARSSSQQPGRTTTPSRCSPTPIPRWSTSSPPTSTTTCSPNPRPTGSGAGTSSTVCGA